MYILTSERYKKHIKSEKLKYLPDFFLPTYRPKILDTITKEDKVLGKVVGLNIKPIDFSNSIQVERYIENIMKIKSNEDEKIYLEDYESIPLDIMDYITKKTELKFITGDNTRILNIPNIIQEVHKVLKQDYSSKDTLIVCSDINILKDIIDVLSEYIKFITVVGIDKDIKEEVYGEILDSTGISIFQPKSLEKIIKNYGIIINFNDIIDFDIKTIRNEALILDFSKSKPFDALNNLKKNIVIKEINFELDLDCNHWLDKRVNASLLESLNQHEGQKFKQIKTKNDFYFINDFISREIKWRGRI